MSQAVIYLARGIGGGIEAANTFISSLDKYSAGLDYDLIVLAKGWEGVPGRGLLGDLIRQHGGQVIPLPDEGYDWGAYMRAANKLQHNWFCFLNTHSCIEQDNWLKHLRSAAEEEDVGAAGATGSWGTIAPVSKFYIATIKQIMQNKGIAKAAIAMVLGGLLFPIRWLMKTGRFPGYPNPHLRSNAFLVKRSVFLEFTKARGIPKTKHDTFELESGRRGFSRFLKEKGLKTVVVGADGCSFEADDWIDSNAFRVPGQTNLLVSDNQTRSYDTGLPHVRRIMELSAWGRVFS